MGQKEHAMDKVRVETNGPVITVILNRPEVRNAIDPDTARGLQAAFRAFEADDTAAVAVLCGAGGCFCAGYDLKALAARGIPESYRPDGEPALGVTRTLLDKPVIAAVDGHAVAGGLELALWCDLRVMETDAQFGVFCRRWGVPLIDGGTVRLPRLIGMSRALDMILTGRPVGAEEALSWGLANRVVPKGRARAAAEDLAREIARFPQLCLRADRLSCHRQWDFDLGEALKFEGRNGERPVREEARTGAGRFAAGLGRSGSFETI
jgi:enoyl-CoA hydratase